MNKLSVAVIGGGTAGFLAAAHISHFFPQHELFQIYDANIEPLSVGEGTLPFFTSWLGEITGLCFPEIQNACEATLKYGIEFTGWGKNHTQYSHLFARNGYAYHISARKLATLLQKYVRAQVINQQVVEIHSLSNQARIIFHDNNELLVDFVLDARGFPKELRDEHIPLSEIPTNAALIQRTPPGGFRDVTKAIAMTNGWIFAIPLVNSTSYGYIFNDRINSTDEVWADFDAFFQQTGLTPISERVIMRFPSFMQKEFFDGVIFKIGNRASFLEPLEATAIAITLEELKIASYWLAGTYLNDIRNPKGNEGVIETINQHLAATIGAVSLFVSWHYSMGSIHDSLFWHQAQNLFKESSDRLKGSERTKNFTRMVMAGRVISPTTFPSIEGRSSGQQELPFADDTINFGGFSELSFSQVGHGIGYFR